MADFKTPSSSIVTPAPAISVWSAEVLARHLVSSDPTARTLALGMAVQPGAPIDHCVQALVRCAELSLSDPLAMQLAAAALGGLTPERVTDSVRDCLVVLVMDRHALPVRIKAAHAMFRLRCLPSASIEPVCSMLFDADLSARKVALLTVTPFARNAAAAIATRIAAVPPGQWTSEALLALARSAGDDAASRRSVDSFVMRSLAGTSLVPTGIAGYLALAQLDPKGAAIPALLQVAANKDDPEPSIAALEALGELGAMARPVARNIAQLLVATDDPAREELLCRTLVRLQPAHSDVPVGHALQRIVNAPDRGAAAHCMLLCLHPKEFAQAATVVRQRFGAATDALRQVLSQTHKTLTGVDLGGDGAAARS